MSLSKIGSDRPLSGNLLDRLGTAMLLIDPISGAIVYSNSSCESLLGYEDQELARSGRLFRDIADQVGFQRYLDARCRLFAGELPEDDFDAELYRESGDLVAVRLRATVLRHPNGTPQYEAISLHALSKTEIIARRLAAAEGLAGLITWSFDVELQGGLTASRSLSGKTAATSLPSLREFLPMVHPEDRDRVQRTILRAIKAGIGYVHEYRLIVPDGRVRTVRSMANCVFDAEGKLTHLVGALIELMGPGERLTADSDSREMTDILELIERDWNKDIYLDDVAKSCGLSPRAVQRYFSSRGLSFSGHVKQLRLDRARLLLKEPKRTTTVLGVALHCGYQNASHFSRDYRVRFGELPSDTLRTARMLGGEK